MVHIMIVSQAEIWVTLQSELLLEIQLAVYFDNRSLFIKEYFSLAWNNTYVGLFFIGF